MQGETLAHDPKVGEVDPRTYPLLGKVRLGSTKIGSHERVSQANGLIRMVDVACQEAGESRVRVHLTAEPGGDTKKAIEVRIQGLTRRDASEDKALTESVLAKWPTIVAAGQDRWFPVA